MCNILSLWHAINSRVSTKSSRRGCKVMPSVVLDAKLVLKIIPPLRSIRRRGRQRVCEIQRTALQESKGETLAFNPSHNRRDDMRGERGGARYRSSRLTFYIIYSIKYSPRQNIFSSPPCVLLRTIASPTLREIPLNYYRTLYSPGLSLSLSLSGD